MGPVPLLEKLLLAYARTFPVRRGKIPLVDALWRGAMGANTPHRLARLKYGGYAMPCDISQMLQRQFYFFGTYFTEEAMLDAWRRLAGQAGTILDVGANAGIYSLAAIAANPAAVVHAFEPTPEIAQRLRRTAEMNGLANLHVHQTALSSRSGQARLVQCAGEDGSNDGMNFLSDRPDEGSALSVATTTMDAFCGERRIHRIGLVKIDVQGHEYDVLSGAAGLLSAKAIKALLVELNWTDDQDCVASRVIGLLDGAGYRFQEPDGSHAPQKPGPWLRRLDNVLAVAV